MNEHLESAVLQDKRRKKRLISPICQLDAEIIQEIILILEKLSVTDDIKGVIEHWKFLKDEEVRDLLLEWNINHPEGIESDKESESKRKFIDFEESVIEVWMIKNIHRDNNYNYATHEMEYRIIVNKDLPERFGLVDLTFSYSSIELRESQLKKLKKYLSKFIKIV